METCGGVGGTVMDVGQAFWWGADGLRFGSVDSRGQMVALSASLGF